MSSVASDEWTVHHLYIEASTKLTVNDESLLVIVEQGHCFNHVQRPLDLLRCCQIVLGHKFISHQVGRLLALFTLVGAERKTKKIEIE